MKQFLIILKHELAGYFKNKVFLITTLVLVLGAAGFLTAPRIIETIKTKQTSETAQEDKKQILIKTTYQDKEQLNSFLSQRFPQQYVKITNDSVDQIKSTIKDKHADSAFIIEQDLKSFTYLTNVATIYDANIQVMNKALKDFYTTAYLKSHGLSPNQIAEVQNQEITQKLEFVSQDGSKNYWYAYVMVFVLYMVVIIFGQKVTMSVVTEKTSRAMEVLITSASPIALMFGKISASCIAGLVQIIAIFGSAQAAYLLNKSYFEGNAIVEAIFNFPTSLVGFLLIFFLLGYLIYSFLYGAMGSTVSKVEDISSAIMLVQLVFVLGFVVSMFSMSSGEVNTPLMQVLSIFPFTSPMVMFTRIAMSEVPAVEVIASILALIITTGIIGVIAAKIYRVGVLMYGTRPTMRGIIKAIREN